MYEQILRCAADDPTDCSATGAQSTNGKPVVPTFGVPQPVPGSDWGWPLRMTGLKKTWRRPKYVFGTDGLQALQLAMQCAGAVLESERRKLE